MAAILLAALPALADAPLPPPATVRALSPDGSCLVTAALGPARIIVQKRADPDRILWSLPFWSPNLLPGKDCAVLGAGYDRGSLLVLAEKAPDTVVMTFYRDGGIVRLVRLGDLYTDLAVLPRTASHWRWHDGVQWSGQTWTVRTVDGRTLSFTP